jgi:hypothetical protein
MKTQKENNNDVYQLIAKRGHMYDSFQCDDNTRKKWRQRIVTVFGNVEPHAKTVW